MFMENKFIPVSEPNITQKELKYVVSAVKSGWVSSLGEFITRFEDKFASFIGTKYALAVSNGTTGLHLALASLGIKKGDEVIIPDLTFVATANAVLYTGAIPVLVDIDPFTWCIDPKAILKAITPKTKCIIPVHLYGQPANMDEINNIAKKFNLYVVEDCAEAHGAEFRGKKVGSLGTCGVFSFYGNKIITTGEGGMITTNNRKLYETACLLRDHAMSKKKKYWHERVGFNYRLTNIQAALGLAQLERIDNLIDKKINIFSWYKNNLEKLKNIRLNPESLWAKNVYWMICLYLTDSKVSRQNLMEKLKSNHIDSRPFFYPISQMPLYKQFKHGNNKQSYQASQHGLNLPSSTKLTKKDVDYICQIIKKILN